MLGIGTATGATELGGGVAGAVREGFAGDERYPNPLEAWGRGFSRGVGGVQGGEKFGQARQAENLARARLGLPPVEEMWPEEMILSMVPLGPKRPPHVPNVRAGDEIIQSAEEMAKEITKRRASRYRLEQPEQGRTAVEQLEDTVTDPRVVDPRTQYLEEPEPMDRLNMLDRIIEDVRDAQTVEDLETGLIQGVAPTTRQRVAEIFPQERNVPETWMVREAAGEPTRQARLAADIATQDLDIALIRSNELGIRTPEGREVFNEAYNDLITRIAGGGVDPAYLSSGTLEGARYYVLNPANAHGMSPEAASNFVEHFLRPHRGLEHVVPPSSTRGAYEGGQDVVNDLIDYTVDARDLPDEDLQEAFRWLDSRRGELTDSGREALDVVEEQLGRRGAGPAEFAQGARFQEHAPRDLPNVPVADIMDDQLFYVLDNTDYYPRDFVNDVVDQAQSRGLIDENWRPRLREGVAEVDGIRVQEPRLVDALIAMESSPEDLHLIPTEDLEDLHSHLVREAGHQPSQIIDDLLNEIESVIDQRPPGPSPTTGQAIMENLRRGGARRETWQESMDRAYEGLRSAHILGEGTDEEIFRALTDINRMSDSELDRMMELPQASESLISRLDRMTDLDLDPGEAGPDWLNEAISLRDRIYRAYERVHNQLPGGGPPLEEHIVRQHRRALREGGRPSPSRAERRATAPPEERQRLHDVDRQRHIARQRAFDEEALRRQIDRNRDVGLDYSTLGDEELLDYHDKLETMLSDMGPEDIHPIEREELASLLEEILTYIRERGL
jgi:hypothetical protein